MQPAVNVTPHPMDVHVRWMRQSDLAEVLAIESSAFEFPWTEQDLISRLRQRNCIGMVAEKDDRVVGYMVYELHKFCLELLSLAVMPSLWRRRIGCGMVEKLKEKLSPDGRTRITLRVRESNLAAQLFFRSQGFRAIMGIRGLYEETDEDAYVMAYRLPRGLGAASGSGVPQ